MVAKPAPKPKVITKNRFVLHEHYASHHHFDFRLEKFGVLKSWALPKGMPIKVGEKRLAVMTENHPLSYINFKGVTPKGQYGAGTTYIKDNGVYQQLKWTPDEISIILEGKNYKGKYALIRLPKAGKDDWIMVKGADKK
jgi:DNA ligase D-like protein (predicted 3'-phosphoesterase)